MTQFKSQQANEAVRKANNPLPLVEDPGAV